MRLFLTIAVAAFGGFLAIAALSDPVAAQKRVALVVGIDKYDNLDRRAQLQKARADARAVAETLKALKFEIIHADDTTRSAFNNLWQDFLNRLAPGDTAAFFFAGHGIELGGRNYLLPSDVPNVRPGRDELLKRESLSLQEFLTDLREKGTRLNLVIVDACRDNPFDQVAGRSVGASRGLVVTEPPEGTFVMYSAGSGESALDRLDDKDSDPNSVYTRQLLPLLRSPGMGLTDVAEQVRVHVRQAAAAVRHRQTPAYYNQVLGRVCLAGGECGLTMTQPAAPPTALRLSEAAEAWDRTKDTTSLAVLELFVSRYKDTFYADWAKLRIEELKKQQVAAAREAEVRQAEAAKVAAEAQQWAAEKKARDAEVSKQQDQLHKALQEVQRARDAQKVAESERAAAIKAADEARKSAEALKAQREQRVAVVIQPSEVAPKISSPEKKTAAVAPPPSRPPAGASPVEPAVGVFSPSRAAATLSAGEERSLKPGAIFKECAECPEMVVLPPGSFTMGSPTDEKGRHQDEGPQRKVTISRSFAAGRFEVTFDEWDACAAAGGCNGYRPADRGWGRGRMPVIGVSWSDANAYVSWLSKTTNKRYRLLSEAEWEYAARAGTTTPFWFGSSITTDQANYNGTEPYGSGTRGEYRRKTMPVDSFSPNPFGLYQVNGNVLEWVADCWRANYQQAPTDGSSSSLRKLR